MAKRRKYSDFSIGPVDGEMTDYRRHVAPQCPAKDRIHGECRRCQGVRGHPGWHWYYRPNGWLVQWPSKKDIKGSMGIARRHTPPGHKLYVNPVDKIKEHHTAFDRIEERKTRKPKRGQ